MQLCIWYPFRMGSGMPPQSRVSRAYSLASCVLSMASEPLGGETWWQNKGRLLKLMLASGLVLNFCFRSAVWEVSPSQVLVAGNSTMPSGSRETVLSKTMGQWFGEMMAQQLRMHTVLAEEPRLLPRTHPWGSDTLLGLHGHLHVYAVSRTQTASIYIIQCF